MVSAAMAAAQCKPSSRTMFRLGPVLIAGHKWVKLGKLINSCKLLNVQCAFGSGPMFCVVYVRTHSDRAATKAHETCQVPPCAKGVGYVPTQDVLCDLRPHKWMASQSGVRHP